MLIGNEAEIMCKKTVVTYSKVSRRKLEKLGMPQNTYTMANRFEPGTAQTQTRLVSILLSSSVWNVCSYMIYREIRVTKDETNATIF